MKLFIIFVCISNTLAAHFDGLSDDKYDLRFMPWDMAPVWYLIGTWENVDPQKTNLKSIIPFPDSIDIGIDPLPRFGFRSLNISGTVRDDCGKIVYSEWGQLVVANKSSWDSRNKVAFYTASDSGNAIMEEGSVANSTIVLSTLSFAQRSINIKKRIILMRMTREITVKGDFLQQKIKINLNDREENHIVIYQRRRGQKCFRKCFSVGKAFPVKYPCSICINPGANWFPNGRIPVSYDSEAPPVQLTTSNKKCIGSVPVHVSLGTTIVPIKVNQQQHLTTPRRSKLTSAQSSSTSIPRSTTLASTEVTTRTTQTTSSGPKVEPVTTVKTAPPQKSTPTTSTITTDNKIEIINQATLNLPSNVKINDDTQFEGGSLDNVNNFEKSDKAFDLTGAVKAFYSGVLEEAVDLFYTNINRK